MGLAFWFDCALSFESSAAARAGPKAMSRRKAATTTERSEPIMVDASSPRAAPRSAGLPASVRRLAWCFSDRCCGCWVGLDPRSQQSPSWCKGLAYPRPLSPPIESHSTYERGTIYKMGKLRPSSILILVAACEGCSLLAPSRDELSGGKIPTKIDGAAPDSSQNASGGGGSASGAGGGEDERDEVGRTDGASAEAESEISDGGQEAP